MSSTADLILDESMSTTAQTPQESSKKKRAPNWTPQEEEQLAQSWIHISKDSKYATNQFGTFFFKRVEDNFDLHCKITYCNWECIHTRRANLNTATLKFLAIYRSIEQSPPSGSSPMDWMWHAKELYSQQTKGQQFKLKGTWEILRHHPKWMGNGPSGITSYSQPSSPSVSKPTLVQPPGVKASKHKQTPSEPNSKPSDKFLANQLELLEASHQNKIAEQTNLLAEMFYDLEAQKTKMKVAMGQMSVILQLEANCPDDESKEMFRMLKKKIWLKLED